MTIGFVAYSAQLSARVIIGKREFHTIGSA